MRRAGQFVRRSREAREWYDKEIRRMTRAVVTCDRCHSTVRIWEGNGTNEWGEKRSLWMCGNEFCKNHWSDVAITVTSGCCGISAAGTLHNPATG